MSLFLRAFETFTGVTLSAYILRSCFAPRLIAVRFTPVHLALQKSRYLERRLCFSHTARACEQIPEEANPGQEHFTMMGRLGPHLMEWKVLGLPSLITKYVGVAGGLSLA